jgi:predicted nucleic acid-binding protein
VADPHLVDTNILLRLVRRNHAEYPLVRDAVTILRRRGVGLYYTLQNMAEFWNACTRPRERNGLGLSIAEAAEGARELEEILTLLPENAAVYREWRRLVVAYQVSGVKVLDARLVAVLRAYRIRHLLTFNEADFRRYEEVVVVRPESIVG